MCVNYDPIRPDRAGLLEMPKPAFTTKQDVFRGGFGAMITMDLLGHKSWKSGRFGLVPTWVKSIKELTKYDTWNAKIETVASKRSYKESWKKSQFCLIACERVYEPKWELVDGQLKNTWYGIERQDKLPYTIAAIYQEYTDELDPSITRMSFSMLTTDAATNPLMSQFHRPEKEKRSVIQVPPNFRDAFLVASPDEAREMLSEWGSLPANEFVGYPKVTAESKQSSLF